MTTEELLNNFIEEGVRSYKKNNKGNRLARALDRHEDVQMDGQTFNYWRELSVYMTAKWIKEILPDAEIDVELDGNNSSISLNISDEEGQKLTNRLYVILHQVGAA